MVLVKGVGGGLPLGAFCGRDEIIAKLSRNPPLGHITTFGGHPLSCAAGVASLEIIVAERLWERAERTGTRLRRSLKRLIGPEITAARALGLPPGFHFSPPPPH